MKYINENMSEEEMIINLSGNLKKSYELLESISFLDKYNMILRELDYFDIIGDRIYKLYLLSNENVYDLDETLMLFRFGAFSKEEILENIESDNPVPFIESNIIYEQIQNKFNMNDYIFKIRESFFKRKNELKLKKDNYY